MAKEIQTKELLLFKIAQTSKNLYRRVNSHLARRGIHVLAEQIPILLAVEDKLGAISQQYLANQLGRDKSGIKRSIASLVKLGLIVVHEDPLDKRKNIVSLTTPGSEVVIEVKSIMLNFNNSLLANLHPQEQAILLKVLVKLAADE